MMGRKPMDRLECFLNKFEPVTESGCWIWTGAFDEKTGYGHIAWTHGGRKTRRAHRMSYELFVGEIPRGKVIAHRCDVRCCVNPAHLFAATQQENLADCRSKGRRPKEYRKAA